MKTYELLYIISPTVIDQEVDRVVDQVRDHVTNLGATISKLEKLGRRSLAYEIKHHREGTYVLVQFQGNGHEIPELERRLRVMDPVLRYLTVRLDADLRRVERMKQKRADRRTAKAQAAPMGEPLTDEAFDEVEEMLNLEEE